MNHKKPIHTTISTETYNFLKRKQKENNTNLNEEIEKLVFQQRNREAGLKKKL